MDLPLRGRMLARMGEVSEFMKTLKAAIHDLVQPPGTGRYGPLWSDRFKKRFGRGARGNPLQTMARLHRPEPRCGRGW